MSLSDLKRLLAHPDFPMLRVLWAVEERRLTGSAVRTRRLLRLAAAIPSRRIAPPPLVTGDDLKALGLGEGPRLGAILRAVYDAQLNEQVNSRQEALALARAMMNGGKRG